jgi:hypothetical protein
MFFGLMLAASAATVGHAPNCDIRVGELVPNAHVARDLAEAIIRSRQSAQQRSRYSLDVEQDGASGWLVFQYLSDKRSDANGGITITAGGGGLGMRINRWPSVTFRLPEGAE